MITLKYIIPEGYYSLQSLGKAPQDTLKREGVKVEMNTPEGSPQSTSFQWWTILWKLILNVFHNNYDVFAWAFVETR